MRLEPGTRLGSYEIVSGVGDDEERVTRFRSYAAVTLSTPQFTNCDVVSGLVALSEKSTAHGMLCFTANSTAASTISSLMMTKGWRWFHACGSTTSSFRHAT